MNAAKKPETSDEKQKVIPDDQKEMITRAANAFVDIAEAAATKLFTEIETLALLNKESKALDARYEKLRESVVAQMRVLKTKQSRRPRTWSRRCSPSCAPCSTRSW